MGCLDETTVARFLDKSLSGDEAARVAAHIDTCDDCRRLVSALAVEPVGSIVSPQRFALLRAPAEPGLSMVVPRELSSFARGFEPAAAPHALDADPEPTEVGRYRLTKCIGRGAMGAVYAARDPELGREIAIKLVRFGHDGANDRLLREAQALAKVSHPNVVAVYDVGTIGDQLFLAMELVRSGTLRDWLRTQRSIREIVGVMIGVARGLAAAHARGLVHRDVKPDNILIDPDGRVRIGDFGLANSDARATRPSAPGLPTLTHTGTLIGTPAYMAPEQFAGGPVDARTDQFGLCATLHEAIYGVRPFAGDDLATLAAAVDANDRVAPPERRVPRWLRAVIDRGLAPDPAARFASMDALVGALSTGTRRRRRARGGALIALGAAAGIAGAFALRSPGGGDACTTAGRDIDQVWNPTVRAAIADAFAATGKPFAVDTATRVTARLDDYANAWAATARDACARDDDVQLACLRQRRDDLAALARLLAAADDKLAARAIDAVAKLPPIARCDDLAALRREAAARPDPIATALRGQLSEVVASIAAGKRDRARVLARELASATQNVGDPELRVAALSRLAEVEAAAGNIERARALLEEAIATADRAGADRLRGEAWAQLISILSARRDDIALAKRLAPQAEAAVARLGPAVSPTLEIKWLNASGTLLAATDPRAAADKFRQAAARAAATVGKAAPLYVEMLEQLAGAEQPLVTPQAHLDAMLKIVELDAQLYGEHHPTTADQRLYLGEAYMLVGKPEDAIAALRRAAADLAGAYSDDDPSVADARTRLAGALQLVGKLPDAIAENERALAIRRKRFPPGSAFIIESLIQRGRLQGATGAWRDAIATLTGVRELAVDKLGPADLQVAEIEKDLGYAYGHIDRFADAEARYRHALELEEAALGRDSPALAGPLRQLGTVLVMAHKERDAIAPLERALAILATGAGDPVDLADVRLQLGYALAGSDKKRALDLANQALAEYTKQQIAEARAEASALVAKLSR